MNSHKKLNDPALNSSLINQLQLLYQQHYMAQLQNKQNENLKGIEELLKGEINGLSLNGGQAIRANNLNVNSHMNNNNNSTIINNYINANNEVNNYSSANTNNTFYIIDSNQNIQTASNKPASLAMPPFGLLHPQHHMQQQQQQQQQQQNFMQHFISNFAATKNSNNNWSVSNEIKEWLELICLRFVFRFK